MSIEAALHAAEFRRCLVDSDVDGAIKLWAHVAPHLAQPQNRQQAEATLHRARTEAQSVPFKLRAYSHRWLVGHGLPSGLPDVLKPKAERVYPQVAEGVGISVNFKSPILKPAATEIRQAMSDTVMELRADGVRDPVIIKAGMMRAKDKSMRQLFGRLG